MKEISSVAMPGEFMIIKKPEEVTSLLMNGEELSPLGKDNYLAVAGIYGGNAKVFHGELEPSSSWAQGWLQPVERKVFRHYTFIEKRELDSGNTLRLPASVRLKLEEADDLQKTSDRNRLITALSAYTPQFYSSCWTLPVESTITSRFAAPRTLPSGRSYYHSGVDLRARTGTPIVAVGAGDVVFAGHMTVPGNNVIVDHGHGLFTRYLHLQKVAVKLGQHVQAGESVGLAGDTGRVEAPHLHWEVVWKGQHANPISFLEQWNETFGLASCRTLSLNK